MSDIARDTEGDNEDCELDSVEFDSLDFSKALKLLVGPEEKLFIVPEDLITSRSTFFKTACTSRWKQNDDAITLPLDDPEIFNLYLSIVYRGGLDDIASKFYSCSLVPAKVWILADKLGDERATEHILYTMTWSKKAPDANVIGYVYRNTTKTAKLRKRCVDFYVLNTMPNQFIESPQDFPGEFVLDMAVPLMEKCHFLMDPQSGWD